MELSHSTAFINNLSYSAPEQTLYADPIAAASTESENNVLLNSLSKEEAEGYFSLLPLEIKTMIYSSVDEIGQRSLAQLNKTFGDDYGYPDIREWMHQFANQLANHAPHTKKLGSVLAIKLFSFPNESKIAQTLRDHLLQLPFSTDFLRKAEQLDEWAKRPADLLIEKVIFAIEVTSKTYTLMPLDVIPKNLIINQRFIADPRIMLYNIFSKTGGLELARVDATLEMQVALICANLRDQLIQQFLPMDLKCRSDHEHYLKRKMRETLGLVETQQDNSKDEKNIGISYKRMKAPVFQKAFLKGVEGSRDKYRYTSNSDRQTLYIPPIPIGHGYANPQLLIDHLLRSSLDLSRLQERMQAQYGDEAPEKIKEYVDSESGKLKLEGANALLYSLGYLVEFPQV